MMLHWEPAVQDMAAPEGNTVDWLAEQPPLGTAGSQHIFAVLKLAALTTILPPRVVPPTEPQVLPTGTFTVQAPVGLAPRLMDDVFWNWFWFIHSIIVNDE